MPLRVQETYTNTGNLFKVLKILHEFRGADVTLGDNKGAEQSRPFAHGASRMPLLHARHFRLCMWREEGSRSMRFACLLTISTQNLNLETVNKTSRREGQGLLHVTVFFSLGGKDGTLSRAALSFPRRGYTYPSGRRQPISRGRVSAEDQGWIYGTEFRISKLNVKSEIQSDRFRHKIACIFH